MNYAIDELPAVIGRIGSGNPDLQLTYACALLSELAYYHVPAWEIEAGRRALLVPCEAYARLRRGSSSDVRTVLGTLDKEGLFVVETRGIVAVGFPHGDTLIIAMRGTIMMLAWDWRINLSARMVPFHHLYWRDYQPASGGCHSGFLGEAVRIGRKIEHEIGNLGLQPKRIFLTGHSLGAAVAALSPWFLRRSCVRTLFASPRYCDAAFLAIDPFGAVRNFRRDGDLVPFVPPRRMGYADMAEEFATNGQPYLRAPPFRLRNLHVGPWIRFIGSGTKAHKMELYRAETGAAAAAQAYAEPLTSCLKLRPAEVAA